MSLPTRTRVPLRWAYDNILFAACGGRRAALYRIESISYPFLPARQKLHELARLARIPPAVEADFSLWRVNRSYPARDYAADAEALAYPGFHDADAWRAYLTGHQQHLEGFGAHVPEVYLAVSLGESRAPGIGGGLVRTLDHAKHSAYDLAGLGARRPIAGAELERLLGAEERALGRLRNVLGSARVKRASMGELQWLFRRAPCRGLGEPRLDPHWAPNGLVVEAGKGARYEPRENCFIALGWPTLSEQGRALVVDGEEGRSYQAMLVLGALPSADFPGDAEFLHHALSEFDFPVDAALQPGSCMKQRAPGVRGAVSSA